MNWFEQKENLWGTDIPWLEGLREKGQISFTRNGLPTAKNEAWKYSALKTENLSDLRIDLTPHRCECNEECHCHDTDNLPFDAYTIDFCDGKLTTEDTDFSQCFSIKPLIEAIFDKTAQKYLNKSFDLDKFPFAALNTAYLEQGVMVVVNPCVVVDKPILIRYKTKHTENLWSNIRNIFVIEKRSKVTILEDFSGANFNYCTNIVNEISVHSDATLTHYQRINEAPSARHIGFNSVQIRQYGCYNACCLHGEARLVRSEYAVDLQQEGASAQIDGVYKLKQSGISDIVTNIRHSAPHTASEQLIKGVLDGHTKGIFQGQIHISPFAQQTTGRQLHHALLLSNEAEVDCKPELEIFADDVKCSHGATSGDLDEEQLFYMQSRGISIENARQILIKAYLDEVLSRIESAKYRDWLARSYE